MQIIKSRERVRKSERSLSITGLQSYMYLSEGRGLSILFFNFVLTSGANHPFCFSCGFFSVGYIDLEFFVLHYGHNNSTYVQASSVDYIFGIRELLQQFCIRLPRVPDAVASLFSCIDVDHLNRFLLTCRIDSLTPSNLSH